MADITAITSEETENLPASLRLFMSYGRWVMTLEPCIHAGLFIVIEKA